MKNLVDCTPREFLTQTVKIKRAAEKWLTDTDILNIRARAAKVADGLSDEEKLEANRKQALKNLSEMYDEIAEKHPEETLELIALMCFVDPKEVNNYKVSDFLLSITDMMRDEAVLGFFISLARLGRIGILKR